VSGGGGRGAECFFLPIWGGGKGEKNRKDFGCLEEKRGGVTLPLTPRPSRRREREKREGGERPVGYPPALREKKRRNGCSPNQPNHPDEKGKGGEAAERIVAVGGGKEGGFILLRPGDRNEKKKEEKGKGLEASL